MKRTLKHHGNHVFSDLIWNVKENINNVVFSYAIFDIMKKSLKNTTMKNVHEKLVVFDGSDSPPGFTSVILIDESHITSHCYSDRGMLAIDIFTCGETQVDPIMDYIVTEVKKIYPSLECIYQKTHKRFHYK